MLDDKQLTTDDALRELNAAPDLLTDEDRKRIDADGFFVIPNALTSEQVEQIGKRLDALLEAEGDEAGKEIHQEAGTDRLANLVDKGSVFRILYTHPKFLAAVSYILSGDVKFSALTARFAKPGDGLQVLHRDYGTVKTPGVWEAVNSIWLLDDFTAENGATRVVPGSHRWQIPPPADEHGAFLSESDKMSAEDDLRNPARPHPQQRLVIEKAGSCVVFNCNLWHSGTLNRTDQRRRGVYSSWVRRDTPQLLGAAGSLSPSTIAALTPAERFLMDV